MWRVLCLLAFSATVVLVKAQDLPTNYQYYTSGGISEGLNFKNSSFFTLNGKYIKLYSGAMHYFRVPRAYWRDRLRKIRAAGLNAVETYIPWNLHEYESEKFEFGSAGSHLGDFLHLEEFLELAKEEDLFVYLRPGPFIQSEYSFGGLPGWLLREQQMVYRSSQELYLKYVTRYFNVLLPLLSKHQFTKGGPVIIFQVENEYGNANAFHDTKYLEALRQLYLQHGIVETLTTCDSPHRGTGGTIPGVFLQTANFGADPDGSLKTMQEVQPEKPIIVSEFWSGWFTNWGLNHTGKHLSQFNSVLSGILTYNASVNFYMFHGGTNFGFTNGADNTNTGFRPIIPSYDYDAPLNDSGGYTDKYVSLKKLIAADKTVQTWTPDEPAIIPPIVYPSTAITGTITLPTIIEQYAPHIIKSEKAIAMEMLDINDANGQLNGWIVYRKENIDLPANSQLKIAGHVHDSVVVLVNGKLVAPTKLDSVSDFAKFGWADLENSVVTLTTEALRGAKIDLLVENAGRVTSVSSQVNHGLKGIWEGDIFVDNAKVSDFTIVPLEFKKDWLENITFPQVFPSGHKGPAIYSAILRINDEPRDTYIDMRGWGKGMVFLNSLGVGKYMAVGPQQSLYLPAPLLVRGDNHIHIFESFYAPDNGQVNFVDTLMFKTVV